MSTDADTAGPAGKITPAASSRKPWWLRVVLYFLRPNIGIPSALLVLLIVSPVLYRGYRLSQIPVIAEPFDVVAFSNRRVADEDNALIEYRKAEKLYVALQPIRPPYTWKPGFQNRWLNATQREKRWLRLNHDVLRMWIKATRKKTSGVWSIDETGAFFRCQVLAIMDAARLHTAGRLAESWDRLRAVFRFSRHRDNGFDGVGNRFEGVSTHSVVASAILEWARHPGLSAEQLRIAIEDLTADYKLTSTRTDVLRREYLLQMEKLDSGEIQKMVLANAKMDSYWSNRSGRLAFYTWGEDECSRRFIRLMFTNWLAGIERPYDRRNYIRGGYLATARLDKSERLKRNLPSCEELNRIAKQAILASWILPNGESLHLADTFERARQAALLMSLAAQRYYRVHGCFPETAAELLDGTFAEIPADPFSTTGGTMRYRRTERGAVVWSVGKNVIDDGGAVRYATGVFPSDVGYEVRRHVARARRPRSFVKPGPAKPDRR